MIKKAFTLIELLVVIALIAILAAILFPVFAQAKQAAKKTAALSNIKQNAIATLLYNDSSDGSFAQSAYCIGTANGVVIPGSNCQVFSAYDAIIPFTKNKDIFTDSAEPQAIKWKDILAAIGLRNHTLSGTGSEIVYASSGLNFGLFEDPAVPPTFGAGVGPAPASGPSDEVVSEGSLSFPAETAMFYSARYVRAGEVNKDVPGDPRNPGIPANFNGRDGIYGPGYRTPAGPFASVNFAGTARFSDTIILNFADGHAKAFNKTATITNTLAPDIYNTGNGQLPVYNLPYDVNGIPEVKAEGKT